MTQFGHISLSGQIIMSYCTWKDWVGEISQWIKKREKSSYTFELCKGQCDRNPFSYFKWTLIFYQCKCSILYIEQCWNDPLSDLHPQAIHYSVNLHSVNLWRDLYFSMGKILNLLWLDRSSKPLILNITAPWAPYSDKL